MIEGECLIIDIDTYTWTYPTVLPPDLPNRAELYIPPLLVRVGLLNALTYLPIVLLRNSKLERYYYVLHPGTVVPISTTPPKPPIEASPPISPVASTRCSKSKSTEVTRRQTTSVQPSSAPSTAPSSPNNSKGGKTPSMSSWRNIFSAIKKPKSTPEKEKEEESKQVTRERHCSAETSSTVPMIDKTELPYKSHSISEMEHGANEQSPRMSRSETTVTTVVKKRNSWFNIKQNEILRINQETTSPDGEAPRKDSTEGRPKSPAIHRKQNRVSTKPAVAPPHLLFPTKADETELLAIAGYCPTPFYLPGRCITYSSFYLSSPVLLLSLSVLPNQVS